MSEYPEHAIGTWAGVRSAFAADLEGHTAAERAAVDQYVATMRDDLDNMGLALPDIDLDDFGAGVLYGITVALGIVDKHYGQASAGNLFLALARHATETARRRLMLAIASATVDRARQ